MQDSPANRIEELLPSNVAGELQAQQWVTVRQHVAMIGILVERGC
jgi:hypothetical protein